MEQRMTSPGNRGGFVLVTVLVITTIGLLFGAGALMLFRFQCQLRIDRQHELEKVYAVRSVLNYIRTFSGEISSYPGKTFRYRTGSERDLSLVVRPVKAVFPDLDNHKHFVMESVDSLRRFNPAACVNQYNSTYDYEYGPPGVSNEIKCSSMRVGGGNKYGLAFRVEPETNSVRKWWVNIGMRDTGGWLQEDYGRRYYFNPLDFITGTNDIKDVMRLCIIRNVTNRTNDVGCRYGWPLSKEGEKALVFQITPKAGGNNFNNAEIEYLEYEYTAGSLKVFPRNCWSNSPSLCNMGLQLAGDKASLFYISNRQLNENLSLSSQGYTFFDSVDITPRFYKYFSHQVSIDGITYGGIKTNDLGKVEAPELRAVFEVEAASEKYSDSNVDYITGFRVTPAYQYDVFIEHPVNVTNLATVAQKIGEYERGGLTCTVITYDTHGTVNKGFRKDEKVAREKK